MARLAASRRPGAPRGLGAWLGGVVVAFVLSGCASLQPAASPTPTASSLSGRLSVRVEADGPTPPRSFSAAFDLRGDAAAGRLDLSTPLGSMLAQARWSPRSVVLATPRGETPYADLDALTREVVGESLPVAAFFDWLRGRPWPGAPAESQAQGFDQLGWHVDLARFAEQDLVEARRERAPPVSVRIKLDR